MVTNFFKKYRPGVLIFDIGKSKPFALIIYVPWALAAFKNNTYKEENFASHSMHWESIEMMQLLQEQGFNVHVADCTSPLPQIDWQKYQLIIDERNNLVNAGDIKGQLRIHYATGCHWLFHNTAEYIRLNDFRMRTGISMCPQRQVIPLHFEVLANLTTYFGGDFQRLLFTKPAKTYPLALSSTLVPLFKDKDVSNSRHHVLWLGSRGFIHKGLDIVLEAFKLQKNFQLHICANLESEPQFFGWFQTAFGDCANIIYHGWKNISDKGFVRLAESCIASVYCSAAEGGAGAIIQAMQFGCIPIVNKSTALRGEHTGFLLQGTKPRELINDLVDTLKLLENLKEHELQQMSATVRSYAYSNHSKQAYSDSFKKLLSDTING